MSGQITKTECIANREFIQATWGDEFYAACLISEGKTFLGLLIELGKI